MLTEAVAQGHGASMYQLAGLYAIGCGGVKDAAVSMERQGGGDNERVSVAAVRVAVVRGGGLEAWARGGGRLQVVGSITPFELRSPTAV